MLELVPSSPLFSHFDWITKLHARFTQASFLCVPGLVPAPFDRNRVGGQFEVPMMHTIRWVDVLDTPLYSVH
jgi:hypothetical protein